MGFVHAVVVVFGHWGVVVHLNRQAAIDRITVFVSHPIGELKALVVFIARVTVINCGHLRHAVVAGGAIEGQGEHMLAALQHVQVAIALQLIAKAIGRAMLKPLQGAGAIFTKVVRQSAGVTQQVWIVIANATGVTAG